jgi:hypothetical protein
MKRTKEINFRCTATWRYLLVWPARVRVFCCRMRTLQVELIGRFPNFFM